MNGTIEQGHSEAGEVKLSGQCKYDIRETNKRRQITFVRDHESTGRVDCLHGGNSCSKFEIVSNKWPVIPTNTGFCDQRVPLRISHKMQKSARPKWNVFFITYVFSCKLFGREIRECELVGNVNLAIDIIVTKLPASPCFPRNKKLKGILQTRPVFTSE